MAYRQRDDAGTALAGERAERIRREERADVATRLHDSVLQTLAVIESRTEEPETRRLARRERHDMRRLIDSLSFGSEQSLKGRLLEIADQVEDRHMVTVESAFVSNAALDDDLERLCLAAGEALINAAKHSGCDRLSLFAEVRPNAATATVKDDGRGITEERLRAALEASLAERVAASNGTAVVQTTPDTLTIVEISVERAGAP